MWNEILQKLNIIVWLKLMCQIDFDSSKMILNRLITCVYYTVMKDESSDEFHFNLFLAKAIRYKDHVMSEIVT